MYNKIKEKWDEILHFLRIEHGISDVSFDNWIKPLTVHSVIDNTITICIPNEQVQVLDYIKKKYEFLLKVSIEEIIRHKFELMFITQDEANNLKTETSKKSSIKNNQGNEYNNLNSKYTFDTFVVGKNNQFANSAALAVAETPAVAYNPLFLYGGVGLGKTHLMHSIAHSILANNPNAKILYVTSEKFTNELINAIKKDKNEAFRSKYREVDVLLIDDIQFIAGKEGTQEEFFHTFNTLHGAKKQIIISSDRPPKEIETLEERLRSRFEWGLTADIQAPDYETRMAILSKKCEIEDVIIDNDILKYIADNVKSNIRELEGALTKLMAFSKLSTKNMEINLDIATEALKDIISSDKNTPITPELIINIVAEHFNITTDDIKSTKKPREIAFPRQITMYLCRQLTDKPLQVIGHILGKKDHTTVKHGADKISKEIKTDNALKNTIDILIKKISSN